MTAVIEPQWIAKMYQGKTGRDHLGLGSVSSDQILPVLSPTINVLTIHPRYHSFYTFLLDEFWRRNRPRSRNAWVHFYRPREFIFSVGANLCDQPEHGDMRNIVGGQKTQPLAARRAATYNTSTDYIDSELGGYGLYYRSVLVGLGLIYPGGPGFPYPIDVPTEKGKEVAAAFRRGVQDTAYYRDYFEQDDTEISIGVIEAYIRRACLCQLQRPEAPDRRLLLDTFLHGGGNENAAARRATFRLLLDIADQTNGYAIDQDNFRQLLYYRATEAGAAYRPAEALIDTYRRWRLYQAREYYGFALNALWCYLCEWGLLQHGDVRPVSLAQLWADLDTALDFRQLATWLRLPAPALRATSDFQALLDWLVSLVESDEVSFDVACGLGSPLHEHRLCVLARDNRSEPEVMVAGMIALLGLIYLRFGRPDLWIRPEWEISRMGADGRLSLDGFVKPLRQRLQAGPFSIRDCARWLFDDYVILQHQLVAARKLPDNTYRFQREGERLRFFVHENPLAFMDARFDALSTTIHELGLCGKFSVPAHPLTPEGRRLLHEGNTA